MTLTIIDIAALVGVGLVAGTLGGMLGIGGSLVMIPAMALLFAGRSWDNHHLYQAAAMMVNVAVAVPAALRHRRAGVVRGDIFRLMIGPTLLAIVIGVLLSNAFSGRSLQLLFAIFLGYVVLSEVWKLTRGRPEARAEQGKISFWRIGAAGGGMGLFAGLLGVGGGGVAVPLLQVLCRIPLRQAIGTSAAVMCFTSAIGAVLKVATVQQHGVAWVAPVAVALCLAPSAFVGGRLGAALTHVAPLKLVRVAFVAMMVVVAIRLGMAAASGS